jgi:uncharacterized damage-inducible protein DinB
MYYKISDFVSDFDLETAATLKVFNNLTDKSLDQKVTEKGRSLGKIAWHIAGAFGEIGSTALLQVYRADEKPMPDTAKTIADEYSKSAASLKEAVLKEWNDKSLNEQINMYGETWTKGQTLSALLVHQMHHCTYASGRIKSSWRLWSGIRRMGKYGDAPSGIICLSINLKVNITCFNCEFFLLKMANLF